jgi:hypothetical protein
MLVIRAREGQDRALMAQDPTAPTDDPTDDPTDGASPTYCVAVPGTTPRLTRRERAVVDFEREWWQQGGRKEDRIREHFATSASSYYRMLQHVIDLDAAVAYDPLTVKRLRRQRDQRRRVRLEGRRADPGTR